MSNKLKSIAAAMGVISCVLSSSAGAAVVTKNIHFEVSGATGALPTQSGSFSFAYDEALPSAVTLTAVDFSLPGFTFDLSNVGIVGSSDRWFIGGLANGVFNVLSPGSADFSLLFEHDLTPLVFVYHLADTDGNGIAADGMPGVTFTIEEVSPVPEPASWALLIGGFSLAGIALRQRRSPSAAAMA